jgi:hypothetical protein
LSNEPTQPRHTTKGHSIIRGGSGKVLYDSDKDKDKDDFKSGSTIFSGDGKKILRSD